MLITAQYLGLYFDKRLNMAKTHTHKEETAQPSTPKIVVADWQKIPSNP